MASSESWRASPPNTTLDQSRPPASPKSSIPLWLRAWWPAIVWGIFISTLSTDTFSSVNTGLVIEPFLRWLIPAIPMDTVDLIHHFIRKSAHFTEYFIFCLLVYRGIRVSHTSGRAWHWSWALLAWAVAAVYSVLDEVHQIFVPSRGPSPWDSLLDSTGALFALFALYFVYRRFLRSRSD